LLRCEVRGALNPAGQASDRLGEFGERRGDPQYGAGVGSELVVAAAQILYEGVSGDHDLCCAIGLQSAHGPESAFEEIKDETEPRTSPIILA
jgi:hypothetical protein